MKNKKLVALMVVMLVLSLVFAGCGGGKEVDTPESNQETTSNTEASTPTEEKVAQEVVYVINNEADKLDPGITSETFAAPILINAFEGLIRIDESGNATPAVAEKWSVNEDGTVYTFNIRNNAKWSNGDALTAKDFIYSWKRVLTPETAAYYPELFYTIKNAKKFYDGEVGEEELGFKALDDYTLQVELEKPIPYFMQLAGFWAFYPVHEATVEANPTDWHRKAETYIGNGPFKVNELNFGESVVMEKSANYWDKDSVKIEKLKLRVIPEPSTALIAMESNDVDAIYSVPAAEIPRLKLESSELYITPKLHTRYFLYNNKFEPFKDEKIRKAFSLALDRQQICDDVLQGGEIPAYALVPGGLKFNGVDFREEGGNYNITATANKTEAQKLLAEAGYPNGEGFPTVTLKYWTDPSIKKLVETLQQMWKENLNVDVKLENAEFKVFFGEVQKMDYEMAALGWGADYAHPMSFLDILKSDSPNNLTNWGSDEYDKFIELAKASTDVAESVKYMHQAEDIVMNEARILTIHHSPNVYMVSEKLQGWQQDNSSSIYFKNAYKVK